LAPEGVLNSEIAVSDDSRLIDQALAGHAEAFGELVRRYQDRLFNTMVHVVGHREDARDAVQEAFVQAFIKLETFRRDSAFYTWLYRIALNRAVSRRRRRRPETSVEWAREVHGHEPADPQPGPDETAQRRARCRQVRRAIDQLDTEHRTVIVLREIEGCTYEQIAEILDVPVGTVRSRLHRARVQLKEHLVELETS